MGQYTGSKTCEGVKPKGTKVCWGRKPKEKVHEPWEYKPLSLIYPFGKPSERSSSQGVASLGGYMKDARQADMISLLCVFCLH